MNGNWLNGELTCPTSPRQIGRHFLFPILEHSQIMPPSLFFVLLVCLLSFTYHSFHVYMSFSFFYYFLDISLTRTPSPTVVSKKFRLDINIMHIWELNFILCLEIFVHYDEQLKASRLILGCVPSYTSYQDSSSALMVGNPLLSYLNIRLPRFLLQRLTSREARHLGP